MYCFRYRLVLSFISDILFRLTLWKFKIKYKRTKIKSSMYRKFGQAVLGKQSSTKQTVCDGKDMWIR